MLLLEVDRRSIADNTHFGYCKVKLRTALSVPMWGG